MEVAPHIFTAKVMHKRFFPKVNQFTYRVYYVVLPLSEIRDNSKLATLATNRLGLLSFYNKDHGAKDGGDLEHWLRAMLSDYGLNDMTDEVLLVCMPRVLGYGFNPVSFWLCLDQQKQLRAVLCEVNNTFGETHRYLCAHEDKRVIGADDWLGTDKVFHVSPFLPREGSYRFRLAMGADTLGMWIDYHDKSGQKQLVTTLTGKLEPLTKRSLKAAFWRHPLVTVKTIMLIHWQALKLLGKGIKYIAKPRQHEVRTTTSNLTKE